MLGHFQELFQFRELLFAWMLRELSIRYKQSILGIMWAVFQPLAFMLIFSFVFTRMVHIPTDGIPYPVFSFTALLPWTFFANGISFGVPSLVSNMNLVTKIYFPREIFPIATVLASFIDYLVASFVYLGMLWFYQINLNINVLWVPLILAVQMILTIGIVLIAAGFNVLYRDIRFLVPIGLQLWLYISPVIYPLSSVPENIRSVYVLNPMVGIIDSYRRVILYSQTPEWNNLGVSIGISVLVFITGYIVFKHLEPRFADVI